MCCMPVRLQFGERNAKDLSVCQSTRDLPCGHVYCRPHAILFLGSGFWSVSVNSRTVPALSFSSGFSPSLAVEVPHGPAAVDPRRSTWSRRLERRPVRHFKGAGLTFALFSFGALRETERDCVRAAEAGGEVGKN